MPTSNLPELSQPLPGSAPFLISSIATGPNMPTIGAVEASQPPRSPSAIFSKEKS